LALRSVRLWLIPTVTEVVGVFVPFFVRFTQAVGVSVFHNRPAVAAVAGRAHQFAAVIVARLPASPG
jgi:hypothetical protein